VVALLEWCEAVVLVNLHQDLPLLLVLVLLLLKEGRFVLFLVLLGHLPEQLQCPRELVHS
jgi:hypothetical protein